MLQVGDYIIEQSNQGFSISWRVEGCGWQKINTTRLPAHLANLLIEECLPYEHFLYFLMDCVAEKAITSEKGLLALLEYYRKETGITLSLSFLLANYRARIADIFEKSR